MKKIINIKFMKVSIKPFFICIFLSLPASAYAQNIDEEIIIEISKRENISVKEVRADWQEGCSSGVSMRMSRCAYYHFLASDIELNETYKALMEKLTTERAKNGLKKAERAWLSFRDATCEYENVGWENGSGWGAVFNSCIEKLTKERTLKLKEYLYCDGNDCPE